MYWAIRFPHCCRLQKDSLAQASEKLSGCLRRWWRRWARCVSAQWTFSFLRRWPITSNYHFPVKATYLSVPSLVAVSPFRKGMWLWSLDKQQLHATFWQHFKKHFSRSCQKVARSCENCCRFHWQWTSRFVVEGWARFLDRQAQGLSESAWLPVRTAAATHGFHGPPFLLN